MSEDRVPGDETNVVVRDMLKARNKSRVPITLGVCFALAFGAYMVLKFGARSDELKIEGPVYNGRAGTTAPESAPPMRPASEHKLKAEEATPPPAGEPARVEVILGSAGQLWVDGRSIGTDKKHHLQLLPGKHVLMARMGTRTLTQKLTLEPGESFKVEFQQKISVIKLVQGQ